MEDIHVTFIWKDHLVIVTFNSFHLFETFRYKLIYMDTQNVPLNNQVF